MLAGTANAYLPEGDGVHAATAQSPQQLQQAAPGIVPGVPAEIYAASTTPTVVSEQQVAPESVPGVPAEIYAALSPRTDVSVLQAVQENVALDPAIETAIEARSNRAPPTANRTRSYPSYMGIRHTQTAPLPHGIQVGLP